MGDEIFSYPMKGTVSATLPNAEELLLKNHKEIAEHATIVDLIRNDLSLYAKKVRVNRFRYLHRIVTQQEDLFQVSSEIQGELRNDWRSNLGNIIWGHVTSRISFRSSKDQNFRNNRISRRKSQGILHGCLWFF